MSRQHQRHHQQHHHLPPQQQQPLQQQQQQQQLTAQQQQQQQLLMAEHAAAAEAAELFDLLCVATTMRQILALHRAMCEAVGLRPSPLNDFYPRLKAKVRSWKAQALWKKFDARAAHRVYGKGAACTGTRVLVIGAGPCGLRTAIEAQLLGAKVVVLEKRDRITRNNVLHLWPFVITDLRNLGAKKFYGKFCAGSIDHISIRQLQCMLLKVALLLGVEIHEGVSFDHALEPSGDGGGWRAAVTPADHAVSHYEFDVLIGADGKRNMLEFRRKEFRGKLAIAITANFINKKTEAEAKVEEISGVAFIFNQAFFKELYGKTGIDLENIVYYKDETHYFVMTAKKHSLIDKGVIIEDMADPGELLSPANVDTQKLHDYAREAAEFSTQYQMPNLEFAVNHYGKPDVAMFDFTSMFAAEMSCRVIVRKGARLMQCLVGDSLLEPFWPTGSGCARGFLSSMDAAYAIKLWSNPQNSTLGVLAQRESIYRLLNQTTPDTLQRDISAYTVDPATRYPNLNRESVNSWQVKHLVDTDDPSILEQTFMDTHTLQSPHVDTPGRRKRRSGDLLPQGATLLRWISAQLHAHQFIPELKEASDVFRNGRVLCALINRYRPDLIDFAATKDMNPMECNELAFAVLDRELHIDRIMSAKQSLDLTDVESRTWLNYLDQICELFRGEIPHIKHPKMDFSDLRQKYRINHTHAQPDFSKLLATKPKAKSPMQDAVDIPTTVQRRSVLEEERAKRQRRHEQLLNVGGASAGTAGVAGTGTATSTPQGQNDTPRRSKKRRQVDKTANIVQLLLRTALCHEISNAISAFETINEEERQQRLQEIEENRQERMSKRRQQRYHQTQNFYKSLQLLQAGKLLREGGEAGVADDGTPFEDYSIFLYRQQAPVFNDRVKDLERKLLFPDRERGDIPSALPRTADEQFSDRIRNMEQRMTGRGGLGGDKKPKDLMRAIGKIDSNDWNVREIEKKIELSKKTEIHGPKGREKVPKWSKEQFQARQHKMSKPQRQDSREAEKFKDIDQTIRNLDKQLKEGHNLDVGERGRNKVASIAGQFGKKDEANSDEKNAASSNATTTTNTNNTVIPKSSSKVALAFKKQAASEKCRFCKQTVYLMEKTTVEGLVLHRNCLKCHHCHTNLRLGGYAFDRDDPQGRFYCTQHFRLPPKPLPQRTNKSRKSAAAQPASPAAPPTAGTVPAAAASAEPMDTTPPRDQVDLLETSRATASADAMSDDEANVIDEHEWSGRNFLPESNNDSQSELSSSDESDTESDSELFEEADDSPFGAQTLQLASDWIGKQYCEDSDDSDDFYDSSEDDGKDDTEGEEFKKARELRRQEVRLQPLPANLPTDTETEKLKLNVDNKENVVDRSSLKSGNSFESARSQPSTPLATPTRVEMEQLERNAPRKFSSEIEAISEKLYHMNNMVKMNKDLEELAKENLVKSDILRKLTLKEKWLAENAAIAAGQKVTPAAISDAPVLQPKSKFDEKFEKVVSPPQPAAEAKPKPVIDFNLDELKPRKPNFEERPKEQLPRPEGLKKPKGSSTNVSRSNSLRSNASNGSPKVKKAPIPSDSRMQIQGILGSLKKIQRQNSSDQDEEMDVDDEADAERQPNKQLNSKLKEIQASSFAGTMDHIKSQLTMPTVSAQAPASMDLSKYFPNQKQEKSSASSTNKNQVTLKDVNLSKYFPSSPAPQRRTVETVAERLKKSQTEASLAKSKVQEEKTKDQEGKTKNQEEKSKNQEEKGGQHKKNPEKVADSKPVLPKRQASLDTFSLREHQMDGALDLTKKKAPAKAASTVKKPAKLGSTTTMTKATATSKGKTIKIVKKIVPKGTKAKKAAAQEAAAAAVEVAPEKAPPKDEAERILDEILGDGEVRSPSSEYQRLFQDEKSPSDLSDNIDRILEETGLDLELGLPRRSSKKLLKTKSLGEGEFDLKPSKERLTGVQNILKRFESMSSVTSQTSQNSEEQAAFKLRRMESTTSNLSSLTRSRESLVSASDSMSDLDKTMEYLRNEWRNEATNFLQKKRDKFYAQKEEKPKEVKVQAKTDPFNDLPVQYRDSKLAKFFGLNARKSPEKRMSPIKKKKSPSKAPKAPKANNSLEELAKISSVRQAKQAQKKAPKIVQPKPLKPATPVPDDFEVLDLLDKATEAKELERSKTKSPAVEPTKAVPIEAVVEAVVEIPLPVEDIKNLPKTGCDKSSNSSRRGSQSSLVMSRRQSEISLNEKLNQEALVALSHLEKEREAEQVDELFQSMVEDMEQEPQPVAIAEPQEDDIDADSLCTTISKSPSAQPVTVVKRGSSEDQSIEKLFSHFSDEMLVNVEFDSNDELVGITPRATLVARNTADRDYLDKLESLERDEEAFRPNIGEKFQQDNGQDEVDGNHFPSRPQRRPKSSSSSSEPSLPVAPQRLKKRLSKLDPGDMAPSVQDLLHQVYIKNVQPQILEVVPIEGSQTLRFPSMLAEVDMDQVDRPKEVIKENGSATEEDKAVKVNQPEEVPQAVLSPQKPTISQSNSLKSENSSGSSLVEVPKIITPPKSSSKENSSDWDMEKLPASPMPRRRLLQGHQQPSKAQSVASKESSLEWDMEKLPNSPMLPRRNKMRPISPSTSSVQLLNNLTTDADDEAAQRRLIEDFEQERRQALIKRDESFEVIAAEQRRRDSLQSSSNSSGKRSLPPPTPPTKMGSRRGTTQDTNRTQDTATRHEGTPPMFKKLDVDGSATSMDSTACSTRRSSFAFIELQDNKPVIVPMPKKLKLPKPDQPRFVPEPLAIDEPVPEVFQGRSWPKAQLEGEGDPEDLDEEEQAEKLRKQLPEYARSDSPPSAAFKNRKWPDGKTVFDKRAESLEEDDIFAGLLATKKRGLQGFKEKPRSQSPQPFKPLANSSRQSSKSFSDLKKGPSLQSLSAQSSQDTDTLSTTTTVATARPVSYTSYDDPMDASTQALLDRSKRLHNRKRDFVNERVVERNPYMREVLRSTDRREYDDVDEDLTSYRPRHYASSTLNRFPNASTRKSNNYDYLSPSSDYLARRSYNIPSSSAISGSSYYPSTSSRSSHLSDLFRRRSPASGSASVSALSGYGSKESCIGLAASDRVSHLIESKCTWVRSTKVQTESESTSPDEVELNSATEISTDSEFDNDEIIRQAPKIFIDDTHLRKPTKVQVKSTMIGPNAAAAGLHQKQLAAREKGGSYLQKYQPQPPLPQFKPLVQVDPTLLISSHRAPLQNPRPGDYLLNKTASTEGIASKKSLELKKRYLLGEPANGNKIQKSGSTSVLDSRIRSFQSNISECQKLLNPSSDISAGMRTFLDRTKLGEGSQSAGQSANELMRSATSNVINDLRVELRIQKAPSSHSTDNEKENVFVNCKNELNKGMEYTDAVNATLLDQLARKSSPTTPTNNKTVIEVIDLVTPEKPVAIIDLTALESPKKQLVDGGAMDVDDRLTPDSNKISELQQQEVKVKEEPKPDVSRDVKECIPDILGHIKECAGAKEQGGGEEQQSLLEQSDEEKRDSPEKDVAEHELYEPDSVQIQVPNIPWDKTKPEVMSTTGSSGSICSSSESSSIEDIQHYILESTTSPDTQTVGGKHNVPRLEVHDTSGALMQVDSLMIVNGKYIGDPDDVKFLDMPADVIVPPAAALKTSELEMDDDHETEPVTATPEPAECTVIAAPPPLPEMGPPTLKFDTKNENKIESLKNLPLIVESNVEHSQAVKPITLNLSSLARTPDTPTTPTGHDSDKTPTGEVLSRGSDSETELTGTGQGLTETELSDWTADDCISENFVDMEFVLNSNKGTIKRRKERRRGGANKLPSGNEVIHELARQAPVVQMDGILSAIDIDDIEFMDTGSEGSCAEAYSATNTALIQNRGYMEYIEAEPKKTTRKATPPSSYAGGNLPPLVTKRDEKLGIDYIEQGAYIMHDDAKTPVNEVAPAMTQSLTDSSTLNELDDDSMAGLGLSQTQPTTTEESEALTVVTSPLDTSSPRVLDQFASMLAAGKGDSTPSSSEQQPKTSTVTSSSSGPNSSTPGNASKEGAAQEEDLQIQFEYVRALQQRISQISTQRRKSSKGEAPNLLLANASAPVIESVEDQPRPAEENVASMRSRSTSISGKVPEIPTLSSKLEEITKERTKQKDLIHDLVMDKLQSKKQLNAEKRLHRSRQRSLLTSGYASGASLSPTPKLAAACSPQDSNCSSQAHYHASTAEERPKPPAERPLQKSATSTYVSPYRTVQAPTRSGDLYKPRPFSEHIDAVALTGYKLGKTASFHGGKLADFATPIAPARVNRGGSGGVAAPDTASISASTENLRSEARARARLKSNTELGLSPEEKMQLIRSRLNYDQSRALKPKQLEEMPSGDLAARARKMSASKSVNDLAYMVGQQQQQLLQQPPLDQDAVLQAKAADFTSDPNLAAGGHEKPAKTKSGRRPKDPERRRSLIQSLSSFFQKGTASASASAATSPKEQGGPVAAGHSEQSERPGTSSSGTPTISDAAGGGGGVGGVFSRFRISPKSKEKSKSCFDLRNFGFGDKDMLVCNATTAEGATPLTTNHSQEYLNTAHNSRYRKQTNTAKPKPESFSSSSPQLYIHRPHHLAGAHPGALDDQTPPPIPPLPLNYQRSDDESYANETREHKKQRAISKASRQAELKRLRIAQEIQREQEEIEVQLKDLEARGVLIEKALRGEAHNIENLDATKDNDEKLLKELLEIWRNITALKKRDEELTIRQQELQLEYRHAQLKEELNLRLSCNKLDKSSADVAAEGAILNEMLEIVAKRAALRPTASQLDLTAAGSASNSAEATGIKLTGQPHDHEESNI
ncbi:LOW QUALITY PROTEIN: F-actin-monooxygenase Mical [Drosophila gunungcola]|uniref:LOW QUALITY PROTEIN: F-actin-monooxygenase Mical n=1 Tax=Drosophila gunungcola TaxID=103775 RepID=UPI0022DF9D4B|nr:LOW QUALITY PROTEIN: F-actin-monooxygenase Mical [Drosophila gunungcola]